MHKLSLFLIKNTSLPSNRESSFGSQQILINKHNCINCISPSHIYQEACVACLLMQIVLTSFVKSAC